MVRPHADHEERWSAPPRWLPLTLTVGLLAFTISCTAPAPPDTREADIRTVKDVEAAWGKSIDSLREEAKRFMPDHEARGRELFGRFARLVLDREA